MQIETSMHEGIPLLEVRGEIGHEEASALREILHRNLGQYDSPLLLDLTGCPYMDSGGLSVLLAVAPMLHGSGWVGLVGANADLLRLFEIVALASVPNLRLFAELSDVAAIEAAS